MNNILKIIKGLHTIQAREDAAKLIVSATNSVAIAQTTKLPTWWGWTAWLTAGLITKQINELVKKPIEVR